jgi:hypothetical protein
MNKNFCQTEKALKMARIRLRKNIGYSYTSGNITHEEALRIRDLIREYIRIYNGPEYFQVVCECNKVKKCRNHDFLKKLENILLFIEANTVDARL